MKKAKILVVDDEPDITEIVKARLELAGYHVELASNGAEALRKIRQHCPDTVLLDIMMPNMDGYEVCETLRKDSCYDGLPIIMFSVRAGNADIETARKLGATDYIVKPFEQNELLRKIKAHLDRRPGRKEKKA